MFVRQSKYNAVKKELIESNKHMRALQAHVEAQHLLIRKLDNQILELKVQASLNDLQRMLDPKNKTTSLKDTFSASELKQLLTLCHPDKHNGSSVANTITDKLLRLYKKDGGK